MAETAKKPTSKSVNRVAPSKGCATEKAYNLLEFFCFIIHTKGLLFDGGKHGRLVLDSR